MHSTLACTAILNLEFSHCSQPIVAGVTTPSVVGDLVAAFRVIENDHFLTDEENWMKTQELVGGSCRGETSDETPSNGVLDVFDGSLNCSFCIQLPERPITLAIAIRMAKLARSEGVGGSIAPKKFHVVHNDELPDTCFSTDRAKKIGKVEACSGKIFVTILKYHFGPILVE
ncbi:hypothetical protein MtrunA17_Chr6g0470171 [Medicago truncatula]|uniref:Uncharacterized protein n=1 Tax=Medicago truncatula TaxID=3880 RepID=A0A396HG65_MEDTR|nr:hypothetical protein MtrunA17_Chr6g0470171 [Medicago truncatula]